MNNTNYSEARTTTHKIAHVYYITDKLVHITEDKPTVYSGNIKNGQMTTHID